MAAASSMVPLIFSSRRSTTGLLLSSGAALDGPDTVLSIEPAPSSDLPDFLRDTMEYLN